MHGIPAVTTCGIKEVDFMEYRFEWNFKNIKSQKDYEEFVEDMLKEDNPYFKIPANYEQAARLFYKHDNGECVMIELQVPTYEFMTMMEYTKEECGTWLDAYEVKDMQDYDASNEIGSDYDNEITFDNAEELMLKFAKEIFE